MDIALKKNQSFRLPIELIERMKLLGSHSELFG